MKNAESFSIVSDIVDKFIDVEYSSLTSYDRACVMEFLDDVYNEVVSCPDTADKERILNFRLRSIEEVLGEKNR